MYSTNKTDDDTVDLSFLIIQQEQTRTITNGGITGDECLKFVY